jgi:hypothetical protein
MHVCCSLSFEHPVPQAALDDIIASLTADRSSIANGMVRRVATTDAVVNLKKCPQVFALHHAEAGSEVCFRIRDSICAASTPLHACIARLLLLSDILFNRYPIMRVMLRHPLPATSHSWQHRSRAVRPQLPCAYR